MAEMSTARKSMFQIVPVALAIVLTSFSLETPVSHIMLLEEQSGRDLEKAPVESDLVTHGDSLWSATKKLWKAEGWRGFVKGFVPHCITTMLSITSSALLTAGLTKLIPAPRQGTVWFLMNALFVAAIQNVLTTLLVTPATILRTRLRLQPAARSTRQEWQYLYLRTKPSEWFSPENIVPAVLRYAVHDTVRILMDVLLPLPVPSVASGAELMERVTQDMWRGSAASLVSTVLAVPFKRCQELSAVTMKPLEEPSVPIYQYKGMADEIVRDSAWNGFYANVHECMLAAAPTVVFFLPLNVFILRQMRASGKV